MLHLVIKEFAEVLHINLCFLGIDNGSKAVQLHMIQVKIFHRINNIGQFPYSGRLNQDPFRFKLIDNLLQCTAEISYQAAADAAGIHFIDLNTGIFQETSVNTDFSEFILDQNQLFPFICLFDQLLDQRGFAGPKKTGKNIYFNHTVHLFSSEFPAAEVFTCSGQYYYSTTQQPCSKQGNTIFFVCFS